ncbi:tyrosine-type recombinase/integrase [Pseudenhygromyxa sp. WMMC2535]|nr:tyrosine-type recombinase/integrase [Pseudenhygromyxa sp. WMMC2535]
MVHIEYKHPNGSRQTIRKVSPVQTKRGAEQYEREVRQALLDGAFGKEEAPAPAPVQAPTFGEFAEEFLANYAEVNNKHSEVVSKRTIFGKHLVPFFGRMRLGDIGMREIERYKAAKLKTHAKKTVNNQLTVLRKTLTTAVDWGLLEQVPRIVWLAAPAPSFRFLDFDEADRLIAASESEPEWQGMIVLALRTGLRLGEPRALQWGDIDLARGRMLVQRSVTRGVIGTPKSGKSRDMPLGASVVQALQRHRHLRGPWVFCQEDGNMLSKGQTKWPLRRAQRKAGILELGWHDLRHSFASHLVMRGVPLKAVQELLGHQSIDITMRYAHLAESTLRDAVELLEPQHAHSTWTAHGTPKIENG